jgi:hypothetical protein
MAQALTQDDELVVARCDLDLGRSYKENIFNFALHRQPAGSGPWRLRSGIFEGCSGRGTDTPPVKRRVAVLRGRRS